MPSAFDINDLKNRDVTLAELHYYVTQIFKENGKESPELDSRLLICHACDLSYEYFISRSEQIVLADNILKVKKYIDRRLKGEPVSKIIGYREFWGQEFAIDQSTLDPRPDTETLVEFVLELTPEAIQQKNNLRILDLGTGSGCILLSLLNEFKGSYGVGVDISFSALKIAKKNAISLGLDDRVDFVQSNWLNSISGKFDIIVSNPPYIPHEELQSLMIEVRDFDPISALDGGVDGLDAYRKIICQIYERLYEFKLIVFEVGKNQEECVKNLLNSYKSSKMFSNISYKCDLYGIKRCVAFENKIETF